MILADLGIEISGASAAMIAAAPKQSCKRCVDLDLWADEAAEKLPRIVVTGPELRIQGTEQGMECLIELLKG